MRHFYDMLAEHQITEDWYFRDVLEKLHAWRERFDFEFKLELPEIAIAIDRISHWHLGHFRPGHNGFGLKGEIVISHQHVIDNHASDNWWQVLVTLLHELLHAWQNIHGQPGKGNYHNVEFREKAKDIGLIINQKGETQYAPQSPFLMVLGKYGITAPEIVQVALATERPPSKSKLRLWMCSCPVRIRVGQNNFLARCLVCNQCFELQNKD